jgi:hypothetical protein
MRIFTPACYFFESYWGNSPDSRIIGEAITRYRAGGTFQNMGREGEIINTRILESKIKIAA